VDFVRVCWWNCGVDLSVKMRGSMDGAIVTRRRTCIVDSIHGLDFPVPEYPHFSLRATSTIDESVEPWLLPVSQLIVRVRVRRIFQSQIRVQVRALQKASALQSTVQCQSSFETCRLAEMVQNSSKDGFCGCWVEQTVCCDCWWWWRHILFYFLCWLVGLGWGWILRDE
jgi:hypothetical protein